MHLSWGKSFTTQLARDWHKQNAWHSSTYCKEKSFIFYNDWSTTHWIGKLRNLNSLAYRGFQNRFKWLCWEVTRWRSLNSAYKFSKSIFFWNFLGGKNWIQTKRCNETQKRSTWFWLFVTDEKKKEQNIHELLRFFWKVTDFAKIFLTQDWLPFIAWRTKLFFSFCWNTWH